MSWIDDPEGCPYIPEDLEKDGLYDNYGRWIGPGSEVHKARTFQSTLASVGINVPLEDLLNNTSDSDLNRNPCEDETQDAMRPVKGMDLFNDAALEG